MTNVKTQKRLYNVELLRIISMILIIVTHTLGHGGILDGLEKNSFNYFLFNFISSFSIISVNVFVLISGYFLCESKIKIKKILFLILEVFFYSMLIYVVLLITNKIEFSIKELFYSFFPILTGKYWFISCYVLLYIFSPFLKKIIDNLNKDSHLLLVIFCVIIFSILPTVFFFVDTFNVKGGYSITWFIVLYFIASYIRKYLIIKKNMFYLIVALISTFIIFSSFIFIDNFVTFLTNKLLFEYNSIFVLISSVSIFLYFLSLNNISDKAGKIINYIASYTLLIYLIHDNNLLRDVIWKSLELNKYANSGWIFLIFPCVILIVFVVCLFIAIIVTYLYKILFDLLCKICKKFFKKDYLIIIENKIN